MRTLVLIFVFACCGVACSAADPPYREWREEVKLSDGRVIIVTRRQDWGTSGELASPMSRLEKSTVVIQGEGNIRWESKELQPIILDVFQGKYFMVSTFESCGLWNELGEPMPPYMIEKYNGTSWISIRNDFLPDVVPRNLSPNGYDENGRGGASFVPLTFKESETYAYLIRVYQAEWARAFIRQEKKYCMRASKGKSS